MLLGIEAEDGEVSGSLLVFGWQDETGTQISMLPAYIGSKVVFSATPCYPLVSYWSSSFISQQTDFQWLELGSQVGSTTDHF